MLRPTTPCSSIVRDQLLFLIFFTHHQVDSGHGGQTKDTDGDEGDGYDEGTSHTVFPRLISQLAAALLQSFIQYVHEVDVRITWIPHVYWQVDFERNGHIVDDVRLPSLI